MRHKRPAPLCTVQLITGMTASISTLLVGEEIKLTRLSVFLYQGIQKNVHFSIVVFLELTQTSALRH